MLAITTRLTLTASVGTTRSQHVEGDQSMAVPTATHAAQISGDLATGISLC